MTTDQIINFVIDVFEGGDKYTDAPGDHGGATKFGVTRPFLARALGRPVSKLDIKNLTRAGAIAAYREVLLRQAQLGAIINAYPDRWQVLFVVYDFAVNAGEDDAIPALQRAIGATPDGRIGMKTINAIAVHHPIEIALRVLMERQAFHIERSYRPQQAQWLRGWLRRCTVGGTLIAGATKLTLPGTRAIALTPRTRPIRLPEIHKLFGYFSNNSDRVIAERRARRRKG